MEITASDGKCYDTEVYNLDAIIAVGYRINSKKATEFRIWATKVLKDYMTKGFALNDERFIRGNKYDAKYFDELLEKIREIRLSEWRFNMLDKAFQEIITNMKEDINSTQLNIIINANINLVNLYYRLGKILYDNSNWGNKFIDNVAMKLKISFPNQKGYSVRNLKYMKVFYEEYKDDRAIVHLFAQLLWKHNIELIKKT